MEEHEDAVGHPLETEPLLAAATSPLPDLVTPAKSPAELRREQGLEDFRKRLVEHREWDTKLKNLRMGIRDLEKRFDKTEDDMKALQSVGQIVGEVLKQLDEEKFIVKASSGPRYVVGCRNKVNKAKLKQGARVGISPRSTPSTACVCEGSLPLLWLIMGSSGYDDLDYHANVTTRSRSISLQDVS